MKTEVLLSDIPVMPEENSKHYKIPKSEKKFLNSLLTSEPHLNLREDIANQLDSDLVERGILNVTTREVKKYPIRVFLLNNIARLQKYAYFVPDDHDRAALLLYMMKDFNKKIKILYEEVCQKKSSKHFLKACEQTIMMTILVSFKGEAAKTFLRNAILKCQYSRSIRDWRTTSIDTLQKSSQASCIAYAVQLKKFNQEMASSINVKDSVKKLHDFHEEVIQEYKKNAFIYHGRFFAMHFSFQLISIFLFVLALSWWFKLSVTVNPFIIIIPFISTEICLRITNTFPRMLNYKAIEELARNFDDYNEKSNYYFEVAKKTKKSLPKENVSTLALKSLHCQLMTITDLACVPYSTPSKESLIVKETEVDNIIQPSPMMIFKIQYPEKVETKPQYSYEQACDLYRYARKKYKKSKEVKENIKKIEIISKPSTTYCLTKSLKNKGLLVIDNEGIRKEFFQYGDEEYKNIVKVSLSNKAGQFKHPDGVHFGFLSAKGQFNGYKQLGTGQFEFKTDGKRIYFQKEGTIQIADTAGNEHSVPAWKPYRLEKK